MPKSLIFVCQKLERFIQPARLAWGESGLAQSWLAAGGRFPGWEREYNGEPSYAIHPPPTLYIPTLDITHPTLELVGKEI